MSAWHQGLVDEIAGLKQGPKAVLRALVKSIHSDNRPGDPDYTGYGNSILGHQRIGFLAGCSSDTVARATAENGPLQTAGYLTKVASRYTKSGDRTSNDYQININRLVTAAIDGCAAGGSDGDMKALREWLDLPIPQNAGTPPQNAGRSPQNAVGSHILKSVPEVGEEIFDQGSRPEQLMTSKDLAAVVKALSMKTGRHITDAWAATVYHDLVSRAPGPVGNHTGYVITSIRTEPSPTRFLPVGTPPPYRPRTGHDGNPIVVDADVEPSTAHRASLTLVPPPAAPAMSKDDALADIRATIASTRRTTARTQPETTP